MKIWYLAILSLLLLTACNNEQNTTKDTVTTDNSTTTTTTDQNITADNFNDFLYQNAAYLPKIDIDSVSIQDSTYHVYVTDSSTKSLNSIIMEQNLAIIIQHFSSITFKSAPFNSVTVSYQLPLRDSSAYMKVFDEDLATTKEWLSLFSVVSFNNIVKGIAALQRDYPQEDVFALLNMSIAIVVAQERKTQLEWLGINFMQLVTGVVLECEKGMNSSNRDLLVKVLDFMEKDDQKTKFKNKEEIASKIRTIFDENCMPLNGTENRHFQQQEITL